MLGVVTFLVLVTLTSAESEVTVAVPEPTPKVTPEPQSLGLMSCPEGVCECPPPNEFPGNLVTFQNETVDCICSCGIATGELCEDSAACRQGTACTAPSDMATHPDKDMGVCQDRCQYVTCPQYHSCVTQAGEPLCICRKYDCTERVEVPVRATRGSEVRVFPNRCIMVNTNCDELLQDPNAARWMVSPE